MTEYWVATAFLSALANTKTQNPNKGGKGGSLKDRADIRKASLSYLYIYIGMIMVALTLLGFHGDFLVATTW